MGRSGLGGGAAGGAGASLTGGGAADAGRRRAAASPAGGGTERRRPVERDSAASSVPCGPPGAAQLPERVRLTASAHPAVTRERVSASIPGLNSRSRSQFAVRSSSP